jgi:hypothetical protein
MRYKFLVHSAYTVVCSLHPAFKVFVLPHAKYSAKDRAKLFYSLPDIIEGCALGGFNVSNLMGIKRRMIDIGKKITFYFLQKA